MATHSSVLAWRIPRTGDLVGCRLWGRTESDMTEVIQQQQQSYQIRLHQKLLAVACKLLVLACAIQLPDQESNPGPLHWECGFLATGPPGKSQVPTLMASYNLKYFLKGPISKFICIGGQGFNMCVCVCVRARVCVRACKTDRERDVQSIARIKVCLERR